MRVFLFLFLAVPLLELFVLIQVGRQIGAAATIALVILTAVAGVFLLRRQSYTVVARVREKVAVGEMPAKEMLDGLFVAIGGLLLLLPGFISDVIGLCCLLPPIRAVLMRWFVTRAAVSTNIHVQHYESWSSQRRSSSDIIDGEFERDDKDKPDDEDRRLR